MANNDPSKKALITIALLLAMVGGMAAIVSPMQNQIKYLKADNALLRQELKDHAALNNHPWGVLGELGAMRERFVEVETQFKNIDERTSRMENTWHDEINDLDKKIQIELELNVKILEQKIKNHRNQ